MQSVLPSQQWGEGAGLGVKVYLWIRTLWM